LNADFEHERNKPGQIGYGSSAMPKKYFSKLQRCIKKKYRLHKRGGNAKAGETLTDCFQMEIFRPASNSTCKVGMWTTPLVCNTSEGVTLHK
jgi:hypothetical protein